MEEVSIHTTAINLDQLLKWIGIVDTGGQVVALLEDRQIKINGIIITERRKKVKPGDILEIVDARMWKVTSSAG